MGSVRGPIRPPGPAPRRGGAAWGPFGAPTGPPAMNNAAYSTSVMTPNPLGDHAGDSPPPQFIWAARPFPSLSFN